MSRLLLVSNRLPITLKMEGDQMEIVPSAGGLATGLLGHHEKSQGLWIGWPGDVSKLAEDKRAKMEKELRARRILPVYLTPQEVQHYYEGFSNRLLWPLFHHMMDRIPLDSR